ncbi:chromosome partitioning protein ParA, partial [Limosilactobacillus reuteri]|uniref:chromosome partitioning protein ParA n=1 Tax=Limosilactobacillus reuteri TaxID=1598 RepID=UPI002B05431E
MSNTSNSKINKANNPTTKKNNDRTVRVIVGEIGRDTKTGILGRGYSPDNGSTFHVTDTMFGRLYDQKDIDAIWDNGTGHKVKDEIDKQLEGMGDAKSAADSAVKFAESAVAASKVNSDAIVAQSEVISEAKAAADSAAAEIQQTKANAASDVAAIKQDVADMQTEINTAKSANEEAVKSAQADVAKAQSEVDQVKDSLAKVSGDLDTYANSAAEQGHDITVIKQKQGQFEADYASVNGKVNQLQADTDGLRENVKNNQGNIASLQTSASQASIELENAKSQVAKLQLTADGYERTFADQDGRLSKVEQTATEHTTEIADAKGNLSKISKKVDELAGTFTNAEKDINNIKLDAKGLHDTLTGQGNQLASLNVTLNSLDSKYSGITGDLQSKQTALSTEQQQTKDMLLNKADKSEVDSVKGTVNQVSAEQKLMADQISSKVSSVEYQTLKSKVDSMKMGTRNLLHGTSDQYRSLTGAGWMEVHTSSDMYTSVANYHMGDWFTYAATINNTSDVPVELQVWRCDQNKNRLSNGMLGISAYVQPGQSNVRVFLTGQIDANTWYLQTAVYSSGGQNGQHTIQVKDERLVEGNVTGSWESNPTDTITAIEKNSTAIDETNKLVSIKADKTEVNNLNNTAQQLSARLNVMAGQVQSKVDETRVNNLIDGRGFTTQSTVQSLIDQRAKTITESIVNLDAKVVKEIQSITASIDGLQSNVTNFQNNTKSQFTQLSNIMQSKISSADFNALKQRVDMQTLDSADINNMKTSGHYFVRNLANSPISGWVYVDVTGNDNDRIRQDVYQDGGNQHKYRRWFGSYWTGWDEGATYTEINQLQNDINLRVVKGQLMSQINMDAGRTLILSNKLYLDADSVVFSGKAFIPDAAIANISADKINAGWLNTNNVSLGDGRTRIRADHDYMYIQPTGSAASNTGIRMGYSGLDFLTNVIPNGYNSSVPY